MSLIEVHGNFEVRAYALKPTEIFYSMKVIGLLRLKALGKNSFQVI
jgi:hypothetical protein